MLPLARAGPRRRYPVRARGPGCPWRARPGRGGGH